MVNRKILIRGFCLAVLVLGGLTAAQAQDMSFMAGQIIPELDIPLGPSADIWLPGGGAEAQVRFIFPAGITVLSKFQPYLAGGARFFSNASNKILSLVNGGLGLEFSHFLTPRFGFGLGGSGGVYLGDYDGVQSPNWYFEAGGDIKFRLSPAFTLGAGVTYNYFRSPGQELLAGLGVQVVARINLGGLQDGTRVNLDKADLNSVFPILFSQYDRNSFGTLAFSNHEEGSIQNVKVSFLVNQYMEQPKLCINLPEVAQGGSFEVPIYALFTSEVLKIIESTKVLGQVTVSYDFLGVNRTVKFDQVLRLNNRNALSWDDDRKAAAFVSSKDPAVLRYSKYVAGIIRSGGLEGISQNIRYAIGLFECLKLLGINYVIDPTTPFSSFHSKKEAVDFLQFPFQTLVYKGGDCDDLSILYSSVLQSVGIETAFLTIPGHIYMAYSLDMGYQEASRIFPDMKDLIRGDDGKMWMPVEITMIKESFLKAWTYGAQEWRDTPDAERRLQPMEQSWNLYDPVSPPDQDTRFVLPESSEVASASRKGIDRFVDLALPARLDSLKAELADSPGNARILNRIGILYARYGKYAEAQDYFRQAISNGFVLAETNIGTLAYLQKNLKASQTSYEKALKANPGDGPTLLGLALTMYEQGKYDKAADYWQRLNAADPGLADSNSFLRSKKITGDSTN